MKENTANHGRDRFDNDEQKKSNSPNSERENDAPASGLKNNDAWITGLEAKTPMQEANPTGYAPTTSSDTDQESNPDAFKDPDEWKTGDSMSEAKKKVGTTDQNKDREKENSF